jgi:hypothetical protein
VDIAFPLARPSSGSSFLYSLDGGMIFGFYTMLSGRGRLLRPFLRLNKILDPKIVDDPAQFSTHVHRQGQLVQASGRS